MSHQGSLSSPDAPRITVLGTGYLGATHAACMAELGFSVLGLDVYPDIVATLNQGRAPFFEPGLDESLRAGLASGRLRFTTSYAEAAAFGDVHFICVGTPQEADGKAADLGYLDAAVHSLAPHLRRRCLVVGKSTVPVGTAHTLARRLVKGAPAGSAVELAWNPEFLREGHGIDDTLRPDRLVFGVASVWAENMLRTVYAEVLARATPLIVTDLWTAELVKVAANAFLATKISFINGLAEVCEAVGADVVPLSLALGCDERIGPKFLHAGLGFGGGCLPKDVRAFAARAQQLGVGSAVGFLDGIDEINQRCRTRTVEMARRAVAGDLTDARVAVLGASFKPGTDDVRDSPALAVAVLLRRQDALVSIFDPKATDNARRAEPAFRYCDSVSEACAGADVVVLATEWPELRDLDPVTVGRVVNARTIIDARNVLDRDRWRQAGWFYQALGRSAPTPSVATANLSLEAAGLDHTPAPAGPPLVVQQ